MKISEVFASIQGEGKLAGTPSVFIRTSFCNLRCRWCDTPYTSWTPEYVEREVAGVLEEVRALATARAIRNVVITGGEPFVQPHELASLSSTLLQEQFHVTIETNGTIFYPVGADLFSVSPKLANSVPSAPPSPNGDSAAIRWHDRLRGSRDVLRMFISHAGTPSQNGSGRTPEIQFKFVVENEQDLREVDDLIRSVPIAPDLVLLMPQVTAQTDVPSAYALVRNLCNRSGYAFSPRLHIERFGNLRGT